MMLEKFNDEYVLEQWIANVLMIMVACRSRSSKILISGLPLHIRFDNIEPLLLQYGNVQHCDKANSRDANTQAVFITYENPEQAQQWVSPPPSSTTRLDWLPLSRFSFFACNYFTLYCIRVVSLARLFTLSVSICLSIINLSLLTYPSHEVPFGMIVYVTSKAVSHIKTICMYKVRLRYRQP